MNFILILMVCAVVLALALWMVLAINADKSETSGALSENVQALKRSTEHLREIIAERDEARATIERVRAALYPELAEEPEDEPPSVIPLCPTCGKRDLVRPSLDRGPWYCSRPGCCDEPCSGFGMQPACPRCKSNRYVEPLAFLASLSGNTHMCGHLVLDLGCNHGFKVSAPSEASA